MASFIFILLAIAAALAAGVAAGYMYRKNVQEKKIGRTEEYARNLLDDAQRRAEEKKKESILEAKEEVIRLKNELDREIRDRRAEVAATFKDQGGAPQHRPPQAADVDLQPGEQQEEAQTDRRQHLQRSVHVHPAEHLWTDDDTQEDLENERKRQTDSRRRIKDLSSKF